MTATVYTRAQATLLRLIERYGKEATLTQKTTAGDEWNPTPTSIDNTVKILSKKITQVEYTSGKALITDVKFLMVPCYEVNPGDIIASTAKSWKIRASETVAPDTQTGLFMNIYCVEVP